MVTLAFMVVIAALPFIAAVLATYYAGRAWGGWHAFGTFLVCFPLSRVAVIGLPLSVIIIVKARAAIKAAQPPAPVDVDAFD